MKKVEIELFSFDELNEESKIKALSQYPQGVTAKQKFARQLQIEAIKKAIALNECYFFKDGSLAYTVRSIDPISKQELVEFKLNGAVYVIEKQEPIMTVSFDDVIKEQKLETFASGFSDEDTELPYVFDLHWDVKSVGHLAYDLKNNCFDNPAADVIETMFDYGLTPENLTKYYKPQGE